MLITASYNESVAPPGNGIELLRLLKELKPWDGMKVGIGGGGVCGGGCDRRGKGKGGGVGTVLLINFYGGGIRQKRERNKGGGDKGGRQEGGSR